MTTIRWVLLRLLDYFKEITPVVWRAFRSL
jgi:hypothetical protein